MTLPPLPESMRPYHDVIEGPLFTADQMRAYRLEGVLEEREACAKLCDTLISEWPKPAERAYDADRKSVV